MFGRIVLPRLPRGRVADRLSPRAINERSTSVVASNRPGSLSRFAQLPLMDETQIDSAPFLRPLIYKGYARSYPSIVQRSLSAAAAVIDDNSEPFTQHSVCRHGGTNQLSVSREKTVLVHKTAHHYLQVDFLVAHLFLVRRLNTTPTFPVWHN